jgi:acetamidase/formamidase
VPTLLVVADDVGQVLDQLGRPARVVQHLPPRLAVVESDDDVRAQLRALPGVLGVGEPDLRDDVRARLTETERLFVDAWVLGRRPKERHGDGLAWDAPGYQPPDLPR